MKTVSLSLVTLFPLFLGGVIRASAEDLPAGVADHGKILFQQSCAICHANATAADGSVVVKQGPSLVDVFGRKAATGANFHYTDALSNCGLTWDAPTLDKFLAGPSVLVPGTNMPIVVAQDQDRQDLIAYLKTLHAPAPSSAPAPVAPAQPKPVGNPEGDWTQAAPGVKHHITVADLPAPFATTSVGNGPKTVKQPDGA